MAISLDQIEGFLKELDFKYWRDDSGEVIISGISKGSTNGGLFFRALDNGDILNISMQPRDGDDFFRLLSDSEHLNLVLPLLLKENYTNKFGNWEYNKDNGDIRYAVEIPLMDALVTKKQFERIMSIFWTALSAQERIVHTAKTGEVKNNTTSLEELAMLAKILDELKSEIDKRSDDDEDGI